MSKLIHTKSNDSKSSPHINNYSTRGIIHDTRKISNDPTCGRVKKLMLIALLAVMGSCPLSCGILSTANNSAHAVGSEVHFGVNVPDVPVLEIILKDGNDEVIDGGTEMDVTPTMAYAGFNTADVNVTVGTSSNGGYNLKMLVDNSSVVSQNNLSGINSNALVSAEGNTIETLGENPETPFTCSAATATTCNFTVNSWGYRLSTDAENTYKAVPETETELLNYTDGATNGVTTSLGFGVRANAKQAGGYYETTLNFIATANPEEITIDSIRYMQDFAALTATEYANVVSSMDTSKTYTLYDSRDRETYTVQKLADGRIWMLDNLRLGSSEPTLLTKANTNITEDYYVLPASGTDNFDSTNGYTNAAINSDYKYTTSADGVDFSYNDDGGVSKTGVYYNYCAASAGTICAAEGSNNDSAQYDICPKGWRLPTGGPSGEFSILTNAIVGEDDTFDDATKYADFKAAFHAGLVGSIWENSVLVRSTQVGFWSSTLLNGSYMYRIAINASAIHPLGGLNRFGGNSVRCILKSPLDRAGVSTMQDIATLTENEKTNLLASMPEGESYTLTDNRDGTLYNVAKLADGNVWLQDNLSLGATTLNNDLTSSNTNLSTTITKETFAGWNTSSGFTSYTAPMFNAASSSENQDLAMNVSGQGKIGIYYNYCAASANTYCMGSGSGSDDTAYDICPAGWMMPKGNADTFSYQALRNAYSDDASFVLALRIPLAGSFYDSAVGGQGSFGYFWTSTFNDINKMRLLFVDRSGVYPQSYDLRLYGISVRCVLKTE